MQEMKNKAITHGGKFHADDVFSAALLRTLNPEIKILRAFEVPSDFDGIAFDLGWGKYDHHQPDAPVRENGVPYAAFGLLWREFGAELLGAEEAERFDEKFVQPLDEDDNIGSGNAIAGLIGQFNPSWDSDRSADSCFEEAVCFAQGILVRRFESIRSIQRAVVLVEEALAKAEEQIVVLPQYAPWRKVLASTDTQFVVYPSQRGGFSAQGVPVDEDDGSLKCSFPADWAGKTAEELSALTGIATLRFCHNNRFLIATETLEDALKACRLAKEQG